MATKRKFPSHNQPVYVAGMAAYRKCSPPDRSRKMGNQRLSAESGFVIPYVLGVILVVSLLVLWSANSLRDTQDVFIQLSETNRNSQSLDAAETKFLQVFLGATMIRQGLDVSGRPVDETALALGDPGLPPQKWSII
tara:strand:- start:13 stop:423 length:411 start_codon:yes stop_codon:yes gene_type:complete